MDKRTLTALKTSIAHWQEISVATRKTMPRIGGNTCALCIEFNHRKSDEDCLGCPVREKTNYPYCQNSPYEKVEELFSNFGAQTLIDDNTHISTFRRAAKRELDFLISLLPEDEKGE